jgi:uncharacterized membrane protein
MRLAAGRSLSVLALVSLLPAGVRAQDPIDLGALPPYPTAFARGISEQGDVVGQAAGAVGRLNTGVLWHKGRWGRYRAEELSSLSSAEVADALAFVATNVPIGYSLLPATATQPSHYSAVAWLPDPSGTRVPFELPPPPGHTNTRAFSGSASAQVVGEAWNDRELTPGQLLKRIAVSWRAGSDGKSVDVCELPPPDDFETSAAFDVNASGDVVGTVARREPDDSIRTEVVVWLRPHRQGGRCLPYPIVLGGREDLPLKQSPSINERGDVVARADVQLQGQPLASRALAWARVGWRYREPFELPVPLDEGFTDAWASDVNARGEVVGTAVTRTPGGTTARRGVLWTYARGHWRTTLLGEPGAAGTTTADRISDDGDVVGSTSSPAEGGSGALLWKRPAPRRGRR